MQKYRADYSELQNDGAIRHFANWMGGPTLSKITNCNWESLETNARVTVYATGEADTYFSIPAVARYKSKRIRGYITAEDGNYVFRHTYY
jgi:hypothetical protein